MSVRSIDSEPRRHDGRPPLSTQVVPRDLEAKVLRSEAWWSEELRRRGEHLDANGIASPPPRLRGSSRVDVTYWGPTTTGMYDIGTRGPHRHGYHELLWTRGGTAVHEIDGQRYVVGRGALLLIRRDQVHDYLEADGKCGTALRFDDDLLRVVSDPPWADIGITSASAWVPSEHMDYVESLCELLYTSGLEADSTERDHQRLASLHSSLLHSALLLFSQWQQAPEHHPRETSAAWRTAMAHRFRELLEENFTRHHDVAFYASSLAVTPGSLRRVLVEVTGLSTKEQILDRVMVEASRLLRFSDATVAEVAAAVGYRDALYFSRVFRREVGVSPSAFRSSIAS